MFISESFTIASKDKVFVAHEDIFFEVIFIQIRTQLF